MQVTGARKLRLVPGGHYDPSQGWAREPRLREVVSLRDVRRERQSRRFATHVLCLTIGYAVAVLLG